MTNKANMPRKYENLRVLKDEFPVPELICLLDRDLSVLFKNFDMIVDSTGLIFERIRRTSGTFFLEDFAEIEKLVKTIEISPDFEKSLAELMSPIFGDTFRDEQFAVRSANRIEDTAARSFAGLYDSLLNVSGMSDISQAIRTVWLSAYSRAVTTERLHAGLLDASNPMGVIIQRMVPGVMAGVAFSHDPVSRQDKIVVELVQGMGDTLVSGEQLGQHYLIDRIGATVLPPSASPDVAHVLRAVKELLTNVEVRLGGDIDIEWAWDGRKVWLLQARPITTSGGAGSSNEPVLIIADLYGDDTTIIDSLRPLPEFATYFRDKRKRIVDFSRRHSLGAGAARLVRLNSLALTSPELRQLLRTEFKSPEIVLDFSGNVRQVVLPADRFLDELSALMTSSEKLYTIVVREFFRGEAGIITQVMREVSGQVCVVGEISADGLLAINRGTAVTHPLKLNDDGSDSHGTVNQKHAVQLYAATVAAQTEIGPMQIEWVLANGALYPLDFSPLTGQMVFTPAGDGAVISRGYASGPTLVLGGSRDLEMLSIAPSVSLTEIPDADDLGPVFDALMAKIRDLGTEPIIVVERPLAALASLLPYVRGFVFERAAALCHLAILIRERGYPAVQSPELYAFALNQKRLTVDAQDKASISTPAELETNLASISA